MDNQSHAPPVSGRDLLSPDELRAAQRKIAELTNRAFTWHNLSLYAAKITLGVFFAIWFGTFWGMVAPSFGLFEGGGLHVDPAHLFYGFVNAAIATGLAFACTVVPSIFWSSLIAQTPAAELMNKLYAKYGKSGFYVACVGACVFTTMGFIVFTAYWRQKDVVAAGGMINVYLWAAISVFLAVVFPAWALNKSTPEQWIAGMVQAREVARLQHALALEEMIGAAMLARADALLHADLMSMTLAERGANNRELAALQATAERRFNKSLKRLGSTFYAIHGMALNIQTGEDDAIVNGYRQLSNVLNESALLTEGEAQFYEDYVNALPDVAPEPRPEPLRAPERAIARPPLPAPAPIVNPDSQPTVSRQSHPEHFTIADGPTVPMPVAESAAQRQTSDVTVRPSDRQGQSGTVRDSQGQSDSQTVSLPPSEWGARYEGAQVSGRLPAPSKWGDAYLVCRETLTIPFNVQELAQAGNVSYSTADRYRKAWVEGGYLEVTDVDGKYFWLD